MSRIKSGLEKIYEDDLFLKEALEEASIPTLIMSIIHISGDLELLKKLPKPKTPIMGETQGFMEEEEKEIVRELAFKIIKDYRDSGRKKFHFPTKKDLHQMMNFMINSDISEDYIIKISQSL